MKEIKGGVTAATGFEAAATSAEIKYKDRTDMALIYMADKADRQYVKELGDKIRNLKTSSLVLGHQSVAESLIRTKWYNPFPKIRMTERPDAAAASILEGNVILLCDNSPEAMIFPTSIFDFLQETDDFYFPPLTGSYLRVLRHVIFWMTVFLTPVWYLLLRHEAMLPEWIAFVVPKDPGELPIRFLWPHAMDGRDPLGERSADSNGETIRCERKCYQDLVL